MNIKETTEHLFWLKYEAIKKFVEEVFTVKEIDEIEKEVFELPFKTQYQRQIYRRMIKREKNKLNDLLDNLDFNSDTQLKKISIISISLRILENSYKLSLKNGL